MGTKPLLPSILIKERRIRKARVVNKLTSNLLANLTMEGSLQGLKLVLFLLVSYDNLALAQQQANQFVYNGFRGANLSLNGHALIHPNGLLELTNTSRQQIGHAFFPLPVKFNVSSSTNPESSLSFSTSFVFAMVPESRNLGGHGIAFTISPSVDFRRATATQYLGLFNSTSIGLSANHVLAIELDTVQNPEFKDIDGNHVGIDVNNLTSIESAAAMYLSENEGEFKRLTLISGDPMQVWIDYNEVERAINVTLAPLSSTKPRKPLLSTRIELSQVFLDSMYVGFSASTGSVASHHYILGWSFNKSGQAQGLDNSKLPAIPKQHEDMLLVKVMVPLVAVIVILVAISIPTYVLRKKNEEVREDWEQQYGPQRFSYKDLYKATKGFKDKELLGTGGFGRVYRGVLLSSNKEVAVKKVSHNSNQGMKEFVAEIASMGRLRHRNLVQLIGYCRRKRELFLVYDYMPNGSLDKFLFTDKTPKLSWVQRYKILRGVASALLYLHEEWEQVVLHRDVKASNVLLDANFTGRLGDFGLSKFYDHGSVPKTTHVVGTIGYLAPEVARTGRATTSSDVFAFGTLMLEVACGRRPVELERSTEETILADWVLRCWKNGAILEVGDAKLEGEYVVEDMELVLKLGLLCAHPTPAIRPGMRQVVQYLEGNAKLPDLILNVDGNGIVPAKQEASRDDFLSNTVTSVNFSSYDTNSILIIGR